MAKMTVVREDVDINNY
jgi:hypothetical protein